MTLLAASAAACLAAGLPAADDAGPRVEFRGTLALPDEAPDADGRPVPITGLSGVAWLGDDRYAAVPDNSDRLVTFAVELSPTGQPLAVRDLRVVRLGARHDFEDVAVCPEPLRSRLVGRLAGDDRAACLLLVEEDTPAIHAVTLRGGALSDAVPLPAAMRRRRPNRGPESLAVDPDDGGVWTANEEALAGDGPAAGIGIATMVRLVRVPPPADPPLPARQYAYAVDPPHAFVRAFGGPPLAGVTALVALGGGRLLVLERSAGPGLPPFMSRLYLVDTSAAADVADVDRDLAGRGVPPLAKRLLWQDALGCNVEGLCLGPVLADGSRAMLGISDNGGLGAPARLVGLALVPPARGPITSP